jgi:hypothetical protein
MEFLTNTALAALLNCLEFLGLNSQALPTLLGWVKTRSVTLRLATSETCTFVKETTREVESKIQHFAIGPISLSSKSVEKITEYFWNYTATYELYAFQGNNPSKLCFKEERDPLRL